MQVYELHIDTSASSDIVINSACFPLNHSVGDLIAVRPYLEPTSKGKSREPSPLLYKIEHSHLATDDQAGTAAATTTTATSGVNIQRRRTASAVTVSPTLAAAFSWVTNRIRVTLELIPSPPPSTLCASHVELYFNNLYLSRPDSFMLSLSLINKVLHSNQRIVLPGSGARLRVGDMWSSTTTSTTTTSQRSRRGSSSTNKQAMTTTSSHNLDSALITDSTKLIFRSESSRSYIFIEVSLEMWQFEEDGGTLYEKCEMFLEEVFAHYSGKMSKDSEDKRSKGIPTSHNVSVILYGRVVYDDREDAEEERAPLSVASDGTLYRDFFKVILDLTPSPSSSIIQTVASELRRWQELVLLRTRSDGTEKLSGRLAYAHESPVLEATNLALNSFEEHWIDRDLHRTGLEVIVLTAGSSFYQVDKQLLRLTTERMLFHGIGLDLISLSKMPLHSVPLFQFSSQDPNKAQQSVIVRGGGGSTTAITEIGGGGGGAVPTDHHPSSSSQTSKIPVGNQPQQSLQTPSSLHSHTTNNSFSNQHHHHGALPYPYRNHQLKHHKSISSSLRDQQTPSSPLRESHQPPSQQGRNNSGIHLSSTTPQSILKTTNTTGGESIQTSTTTGGGGGGQNGSIIVLQNQVVPDDQRDPLYYDPPLPFATNHSDYPQSQPRTTNNGAGGAPSIISTTSTSTVPPPFPPSSVASSTTSPPPPPPPPIVPPSPPPQIETLPPQPQPTTTSAASSSLYYSEPLFVFPHFFGTQPDKPHRVDRFMPRARCYELFSCQSGGGLGEKLPLSLPLLKFDSTFNHTVGTGEGEGEENLDVERRREEMRKKREWFDVNALGVQGFDPITSNMMMMTTLKEDQDDDEDREEGEEKELTTGGAGGGIVIGKKGNWGQRDEVRDGGGGGGGISEGGISSVSTTGGGGGSSYSGHESEESSASLSTTSEKSNHHRERRTGASSSSSRKESMSSDGGDDEEGEEFGIGMPSVMVAAAQSDLRHSRKHRTGSISTTASSSTTNRRPPEEGDVDRGRQFSRKTSHIHPLPSNDSGGRSKTPVPKHRKQLQRDSSVAASIRTAGSIKNSSIRKASTPALIARLTGGPTPSPRSTNPPDPPHTSDTSSSHATTEALSSPPPAKTTNPPLPRPSWLSLFTRTNSSASTTTITPSSSSSTSNSATLPVVPPPPAPQVAVARVDVQASYETPTVAPTTTSSSIAGSPILSSTSLVPQQQHQVPTQSSNSTKDQVEAELAVAATSTTTSDYNRSGGGQQPTQPITIGSKGGSITGSRKGEATRGGKEGENNNNNAGKKISGSGQGQISGSLKTYEPGEAMRKGLAKGAGGGGAGGRISVAARFNPSKPGKRSVGLADQARRWAGILVIERKNMRLGVKWRSITRGACLPITTDYIPSSDVLSREYSEYRYSVPTNSVTSSFLLRPDHPKRSHILTLVTELICQRLSHGFQIYTPAPSRSNPDSSKTLPQVLHEIQNGETTAVYLSLSNQVHRIWYDRRSKSVFVKILRRRRTWSKPEYDYQPLIWTQGADRADVTPLSCPYPSMVDPVEWQHCDRLVAGAETHEQNEGKVRYRSTRLVLLPANKVPDRDYIIGRTKALQQISQEGGGGGGGQAVTDQMIHEQGFYVLLDLIENARWTPAGVEKVPISIHQTTLDAPNWALSIAKQGSQPSSINASPALSPAQQPPVPRAGWLSRMQSKRAGGAMNEEPSQPSTPLLVDRSELFDLASPPHSTSSTSNPPNLSLPESLTSSLHKFETGGEHDPTRRQSAAVPIVSMTHSVILDLDPQKRSERSERVVCHLDRSHNHQAAYHLELAWLTASGKTVDNSIQAWSRQMARYGLTLVEVSTRPVLKRNNPFQKPTIILPVWLPSFAQTEHSQEEYLSHLLRSLDFYLDLTPDKTFSSSLVCKYSYRRTPVLNSQYIHRSGSGIVSILTTDDTDEEEEEGAIGLVGFAWVPNRIFTSHHLSIDENEPRRRLVELCSDEERLKKLYEELSD
ncbi:hypothetical protein JCM5350_004056 [Sporobolomyces pararoseus]